MNSPAKNISFPTVGKAAVLLIILLITAPALFANPDSLRRPIDPIELESDTTSIFVMVQNVGGHEISAIIQNEVPYLSVVEVFNFLKIKTETNYQADSVYGFFISPEKSYLIDKSTNRISYAGKKYDLDYSGILMAESQMFLRIDYYQKVFALNCQFSFRNLTINIKADMELPVVKEMRQAQIRNNLNKLSGEFKADSVFHRRYPGFALGTADWLVLANQNSYENSNRFLLGLGGMIAGGEFRTNLNYYSNIPFSEKEQYYHWRYVNNDNKYLRQVTLGKISGQSISSIYNPVVGAQFTNRPTTFRRSFGSYLISDKTEPGWIVELYVNNALVNYVTADDAGFYSFEVPLVYGSSNVRLRFYGPFGEEKFSEQNILIPFNFLPKNEWEYTVSAGMVEDSVNSRFGRAVINYGLSRRITLGGGAEYLSSVTSGKVMPFVSASAVVGSNVFLSSEYVLGVKWRSALNVRFKSNAQFEMFYTKYHEGQTAIIYNYLEERKASFSIPVRGKKFSAFSKISAYQIILPTTKYTNAEWTISGVLYGVNGHLTSYGVFTAQNNPYYYSNLGLSFRLPGKILLSPQVQYEYNTNRLFSMKYEVGKYFSGKGYVNAYYEQNFKNNFNSVGLNLRFDFSFAQVGLFTRTVNKNISVMESASGSLLYDNRSGYFDFSNRSTAGRGGIIIDPFLDINGNGIRDENEPRVKGVTATINGGVTKYTKDTMIAVSQLESYTSYLITLDDTKLENISWHLLKKRFKVYVDPYSYKTIEVPISVMNEISGFVMSANGSEEKPMGRIIVNLFKANGEFIGKTLSEADGSFSYSGIFSGDCIVKLDKEQLSKTRLKAVQPDGIPVTFNLDSEGDLKDGIKLVVEPNP